MPFDPTSALLQCLLDHGVNAHPVQAGIAVDQHDLLFSTGVLLKGKHPNTQVVQLDVRVESKRFPHGPLIESCAGWASDVEEATKHAFGKFLQSSFHVLVSSLVDPEACTEQVEWETWTCNQTRWNVCLGPLTLQGSAPDSLNCADLLNRLRDELAETLAPTIHWVRIYFSRMSQPFISEALLDNQEWPELRDIVASSAWPEGEYSSRIFLMMIPTA